jgi:hypothetical protein
VRLLQFLLRRWKGCRNFQQHQGKPSFVAVDSQINRSRDRNAGNRDGPERTMRRLERDNETETARIVLQYGFGVGCYTMCSTLRGTCPCRNSLAGPIAAMNNLTALRFLEDDWYSIESWGVWSGSQRATIAFPLTGRPAGDMVLTLLARVPKRPRSVRSSCHRQRCGVWRDDVHPGFWDE